MVPVKKRSRDRSTTSTQTLPKKRLRSNSTLNINNNMAPVPSSTATTTSTTSNIISNTTTTTTATTTTTGPATSNHGHHRYASMRLAPLVLKKRVVGVSPKILKKQAAEIKKSLNRSRHDYDSETERPIARRTRLQVKKENERIAILGKGYEKSIEEVVQYYRRLDEESDEDIKDDSQKELWDSEHNFISPINPMIKKIFALKNELKEAKKSHEDFRSTIDRLKNENNEYKIFYNKFEDVFQELNCIICSEPCIDVTVSACGHSFCNYCIERWRSDNLRCPVCRELIKSTTRIYGFDGFISKAFSLMPNTFQDQRTQQVQDRTAQVNAEPERLSRVQAQREAQNQHWLDFMRSFPFEINTGGNAEENNNNNNGAHGEGADANNNNNRAEDDQQQQPEIITLNPRRLRIQLQRIEIPGHVRLQVGTRNYTTSGVRSRSGTTTGVRTTTSAEMLEILGRALSQLDD